MKRFAVDSVGRSGDIQHLSRESSHHLLVVCRHPRGAQVILFDGTGQEALAALVGVDDGIAALEVTEVRRPHRQPRRLELVLGLPKGPSLEHALRMAVEIGVTAIWPVLATRSVAKGDRHDRWLRVIDAACQQSGRTHKPVLHSLRPLGDALVEVSPTLTRYLAMPGAQELQRAAGDVALAIGPEGGFTPPEVAHSTEQGWSLVGFAPWVLRVDTAVAVGLGRLV